MQEQINFEILIKFIGKGVRWLFERMKEQCLERWKKKIS